MKSDWIWMPHAGHLCIGHMCRFHLNTYVNGYIISTVGEYWPSEGIRRVFAENSLRWPNLEIGIDGKVELVQKVTEEQITKLLSLKGDYFDAMYFKLFGYEDIGLNRKYETMVFKAAAQDNLRSVCCPWKQQTGHDLDMEGYNDPEDAFKGHMGMCEKWDNEIHGSKYVEKEQD